MATVQVSGSHAEFSEIEAADATKTEETITELEPATDQDGEIPAEEAIEEEADEVEADAEEPPEEETKETNAEVTEEPHASLDDDENLLGEEEE